MLLPDLTDADAEARLADAADAEANRIYYAARFGALLNAAASAAAKGRAQTCDALGLADADAREANRLWQAAHAVCRAAFGIASAADDYAIGRMNADDIDLALAGVLAVAAEEFGLAAEGRLAANGQPAEDA